MNFLRPVQIIFASIVLSPIIFLAIIIYLHSGSEQKTADFSDPLLYAGIIFGTSAVIGSTLMYRLRIPAIKRMENLNEKLNAWRSIFIVAIALIEGATLFAAVCLFVTGYDIFLYISAALLSAQFMNLPTREKIKKDLELDDEVTAQL